MSDIQKLNINNLSLLKIISFNSLLNAVIFLKNVYASSSAFKALKYSINLAFLIS